MTRPRDMTDELRYGGEGLEVLEHIRSEIRRDFQAAAIKRRNAKPQPAEPGDKLCACGSVLSSRRRRCYACIKYESRLRSPRPIGSVATE